MIETQMKYASFYFIFFSLKHPFHEYVNHNATDKKMDFYYLSTTVEVLICPICEKKFEGATREKQLLAHAKKHNTQRYYRYVGDAGMTRKLKNQARKTTKAKKLRGK